VPVRKHAGELVGIRLLSLGDDRGHAGERHGQSTVTTERVRNDWGVLVGGNLNLKHKENCDTWGSPVLKTSEHNAKQTQTTAMPCPATSYENK
jgi:hypothetical protein